MAQEYAVAGEDALFQGLLASGHIPDRYRKNGIDNLGMLAYITRSSTAFAGMLHQEFPQSKIVADRKHDIAEVEEYDRILKVTVASSGSDNHQSIGLSNNQAVLLQPFDTVYIKGLYSCVEGNISYAGEHDSGSSAVGQRSYQQTGIEPTAVHYSTVFGPESGNLIFTEYDQCLVTEVGMADSAGAGNTKVSLMRCFNAAGKDDYSGGFLRKLHQGKVNTGLTATGRRAGGDGQISVDMEILCGMPAFEEGSGAPEGQWKTPFLDSNFTQEFKYALSVTDEFSIPDKATFLPESMIDIARKLQAARTMLNLERSYLFGRKGKGVGPGGKEIYTMGGVIEYIPKDTDHILNYIGTDINYKNTLSSFEPLFMLGGSTEYRAYVGIEAIIALKKSFYDSGYMRYNKEESRKFDIPIDTLAVAGGTIDIVPLYTMTEAGFGNRMVLLDKNKPHFKPVTHKGWDMRYEANVAPKDVSIKKELRIGIKGLERRYSEYLAMMTLPL